MSAAQLTSDDAALDALMRALERGEPAWPASGRVLFLGARAHPALAARATPGLVCQQDFRPFADPLVRCGLQVAEPAADARFDLVMALPPRQREARQAMLARALAHVADGGRLLVAVSNREGARSAQDDLERLAGPVRSWSKHKCRVFWTDAATAHVDADLQRAWLDWETLRPVADGLVSRPGLFAWDHIDAGSALLAAQLPDDLSGHVADLGAGTGYLSMQLVRRCAGVKAIDLFEADARALPAARINLDAARVACGRDVDGAFIWHDVTAGLPRSYDHIVSNPPFHQGRADLPQLGRAFITSAAAALREGGSFWMVANRHLAYEATLQASFSQVSTAVERDDFKVIEARQKKRGSEPTFLTEDRVQLRSLAESGL